MLVGAFQSPSSEVLAWLGGAGPWALLGFGGLVSLTNLYLSLGRPLVYRWRHPSSEGDRWVSGVPVVGSAALLGGRLLSGELGRTFDVLTWVVIALDSGGFHWFLLSLVLQDVRPSGRPEDPT